ncbi:MAG: lipoprotein [Gammaproteobacteria bacterium]|nr:lipoprotein [Gammaproteobacteria bacterium]
MAPLKKRLNHHKLYMAVLAFFAACVFLSACGQKGDLFLPPKDNQFSSHRQDASMARYRHQDPKAGHERHEGSAPIA